MSQKKECEIYCPCIYHVFHSQCNIGCGCQNRKEVESECANCHKELDPPPNEEGLDFRFALCGECHDILNGGNMKDHIRRFGYGPK